MTKCNKRCFFVCWGFIECLFFAGLFGGWPILLDVLISDGFFSYLCSAGDSKTNLTAKLHHGENSTTHNLLLDTITDSSLGFSNGTRNAPHDNASTLQNSSFYPQCSAQSVTLEWVQHLAALISAWLMVPLGLFFDSFGTLKTRLITM